MSSEAPPPKVRWSTVAALKERAARAKSRVVTKREAKGLTNERGSPAAAPPADEPSGRRRGVSAGVRATLKSFWSGKHGRSSR